MARLTIDHFSDVLGLGMTCSVLLPQETTGRMGMPGSVGTDGSTDDPVRFPTLWLLHGRSDDHTTWLRRTSIERYVATLGIAVVTPDVHLSFYTNMQNGGRYWDYISEELPSLLESWLPLAVRREERYVAGLSMGGWGALKLALNQPNRFAAAATLSGALRLTPSAWGKADDSQSPRIRALNEAWLGDLDAAEFPNVEDRLLEIAKHHMRSGQVLPRLYACCGTEDFLLADNRHAVAALRDLGVELTYEEGPGLHEWAFWDKWIQRVLDWMGLRSTA